MDWGPEQWGLAETEAEGITAMTAGKLYQGRLIKPAPEKYPAKRLVFPATGSSANAVNEEVLLVPSSSSASFAEKIFNTAACLNR